MAKRISEKLLNMLSDYLVSEVGQKALSGITYSFIFKPEYIEKMSSKGSYVNKKGAETDIANFKKIKEEAYNCGFGDNELFRLYEVSNGWIYDLDMNVAKRITIEISKIVAKQNGGDTPIGDLIGNKPEEKRKNEMEHLGKKLKKSFEDGKRELSVALFSRNSTPRIVINGVTNKGEAVSAVYDAFALRHTDLEVVNDKFLIPNGIKIEKVEPCDILPSKTGVRCKLYLEKVG